MRNTISKSPKSTDLYQRLAILAVIGIASASCPSNTADAKNPIPFCGSKKTPEKGPWLEGDERATVVCVVDGDTIDVKLKNHRDKNMRVRLPGVDCAETKHSKKSTGNKKRKNRGSNAQSKRWFLFNSQSR